MSHNNETTFFHYDDLDFGQWVFYGPARWPSFSVWLVPGTITDAE